MSFFLAGCNVLNKSDDIDSGIFGEWYEVETINSQVPSPNQRINGWSISTEGAKRETAVGSLHQIGINGNIGEIALIDPRYIPGNTFDILSADSDKMILEYVGATNLASKSSEHNTYSADYYSTTDTVKYKVTSDLLILEGRYYSGTFKRTSIGAVETEPLVAQFEVTADDRVIKNLEIAKTTPTAYISRISENEIKLHSRMGGENITITINNFDGPGTYVIGIEQGVYTQFGTDTVSPSYITAADSSGTITVESYDAENNRYTGQFEFVANIEFDEPQIEKYFSNGVFDLPVFE